ncbi:MAG: nuclear transport factor 2 family protein [Cytophagales bacterium]|nr:nuclear transport factor 2 family protein [Cytophagales bacterium]
MKFLFYLAFFLSALETNAQSEHEIMRVMRQWADAYVKRDAAFLEEVMDDTWTFAGGNNFRINKKDGIEAFKKDRTRYLSITYRNEQVKTYDNTVVVTLEEEIKLQETTGDTTTIRSLVTDVFIRRKGGWKAVATHKSPVNSTN